MKNSLYKFFIYIILISSFIPSYETNLISSSLKAETVIKISTDISGDTNHKKAEFDFTSSDSNLFFKYESSSLPSNLITTFRIEFDSYGKDIANYKVICTNVETSKSDSDIITTLKNLKDAESACINGFKREGLHDGIVRLDSSKKVVAFMLKNTNGVKFTGRINLRIKERTLGTSELKPNDAETYTLVPYSINVKTFREKSVSKILFYSYSRVLQMVYPATTVYPGTLFSGSILSVYTNPNMVRQKYHDASIMTLVVNPVVTSNLKEEFQFEVKLYESNYLLDYYVSSNNEGRPLNKPLLINMTECTNPYYFIFNYNRKEGKKTLVIDQIYGKIKSLSVAYNFTKNTWDEMIQNDMNEIDIIERKYNFPGDAEAHLDVYKIECEVPLMFNFYYIDESQLISKMNYGDINIISLQPYQTETIPFFEDVISPKIIVEIYNPIEDPTVVIKAQEEKVYQSNTLFEMLIMISGNGITIKERGGSSETRIIIKVKYPDTQWSNTDDPNVKYNKNLDVYAFQFPNDLTKFNYSFAMLTTSGTDEDDNVKYCFTANIGATLKPSSENCYRVAKDNPYTLKVFNPLVMYRDYSYDNNLPYYVTFKTETKPTSFKIVSNLNKYNTTIRNDIGISTKITLSGEYGSSIITSPDTNIFTLVQIHICDSTNSINANIINSLTGEKIVDNINIAANTKNNFIEFDTTFLDSQIIIKGNANTNIFLRTAGLPYEYTPTFNTDFKVIFDSNTNTINIESPIMETEFMEYTVIVDVKDAIKNKGYTLCDFVNYDLDKMGKYHKSIFPDGIGSIQINFEQAGLKAGDDFDAIIYIEQKMYTRMAFLTDVIQDKVGDVKIDTIHQISEAYPKDNDYVYTTIQGSDSDLSYYLTFQPDRMLDIPFGALRIELDDSTTGSFTGVYCAFAKSDSDPLGIIEEVEKLIEVGDSYCLGGKSKINSKRYNYIFKYEKNKEDNTPKMLVIKIINGNLVNGKFNVYIRKEPGVEIEKTDFEEQRQYGQDENNKMSLMPYIVDLEKIRDNNGTKISKILFYSKNSELQMYYIPDDDILPTKLFSGNIALVYTKKELAVQKYHSTKLILLSENLEEDEVSSSFRFHTKMFKSEDQIEFFVSQNSEGRTLNFPLSLEMNVCTDGNNKLYYLLNYNQAEPLRTLHLEMIFGSYSRARIAREINAETWEDLITSMTNIDNYQADLPEKSQHIDVIEIECISPLLINAYYSYDEYEYEFIRQGEIVVKDLLPKSEFKFTIEPQEGEDLFYYSLSLFNPVEVPYITLKFSDGTEHYISGNTLQDGILMFIPTDVTIYNKVKTKTRFIFKVGLNVEKGKDWSKDTPSGVKGTLFVSNNKFVYKFPTGNDKKNYKKIDFHVNGINEDVENVKFCYSTNLGVAMEASKENCFRTGRYIPYTLSFINPLIVAKDYENTVDKYYISFRPFSGYDFIKITIEEIQYDIPNRNEEGVANLITLDNKEASSILSLPQYYTTKLLIQLRSCTNSNYPISYDLYSAFDNSYLNITGKTYFHNDKYGVLFSSDHTYLDNQIKLTKHESETQTVKAFVKHAAIGNNKVVIQDGYEVITFDETKNSVNIKKPILNEEFTITIIVDLKGTLDKYTQCDLAFGDYTKIGKYQKRFISVTSNNIIHFIDFDFIGFEVGTVFDLIVYAEQKYNSKLEFLYPVFQGKVGKVSGVESVSTYIEEDKYVTSNFQYNLNSNYLYYDFPLKPYGLSASLKILTSSAKVTKVGCTFVSKYASDSTMVSSVNNAVVENKNICLDLGPKDTTEFNALINANYDNGNSRLVIQILYGLGEEDKIKNNNLKDDENTINIKIAGDKFGDYTGVFTLSEKLAPTPYIIDLEDIRKKKVGSSYVSKILFYSNTTKMTMHYISDQSTLPLTLFDGNIMLVYTNPDLIYQKYNNAKMMILTTDAIGNTENIIDVKYFDSAAQIQYYFLGDNATGRVLNNPTAIEMTSCKQPYYYILNYNKVEKEERKLHIDTIFGEIDNMKFAYSLNYTSWNQLLDNMMVFNNEQITIPTDTAHPLDILEVTCKLPLLLNLYYADPANIKTDNLVIGDIVIFNLDEGSQLTLNFKPEQKGPFTYSFNVFMGYNENPNILINLDDELELEITENGLHIKDSWSIIKKVTFINLDKSSGMSTRIIFKFGYVIESIFDKDENGIYNNKDVSDRTINLYGYKYDTTKTRLNYTGVDFKVSSVQENVKFCYSTNIGTYINPSITNCFRVGRNNPYTISTRNPLIMYRNYYHNQVNNYYVGFRTVELEQNLKITPIPLKYDTTERNLEGAKNRITISGESSGKSVYSTILTAPAKNNPYIFTHIHICTKEEGISYQFYNAYNRSNLGYNGNIMSDPGYDFMSVPNSKLDTELKLIGNKGVEVFVRHVGIDNYYQPYIDPIKFSYDSNSHKLSWNKPIENGEFKYSIFIDKINNIKDMKYTLCDTVNTTKLGRYSEILITNDITPNITIDFSKPELVDCKEFDVIVLAEQTNLGKLTVLSPVYNSKGESSDDQPQNGGGGGGNKEEENITGLIVVAVILSVILIGGGVAAFFIIRKYRSKGVIITDGKATSMAMLGSTQSDKLVESQAVVE